MNHESHFSCRRDVPLVLVPMLSSTPDGTITAGLGVRRLLGDGGHATALEAAWDHIFMRLNDKIENRWLRWMARWGVLHYAALRERGEIKIFTSHHSPFFESGHLVIIHDVIPFRMPDRYPAQTFYTRHFLTTVMRSSDAVITISHTVREALLKLFPEVRSKLIIIPSYSEKIEKLGSAEGLDSDRQRGRFLMVGMTRRHKNLDWGAEAVERAAMRCQPLRLDAVGVWKDFWPDVVEASGSESRRSELVLHEYVSDAALDQFYRGATALLYLSSDEGMGLPPLEALARGCPVVCPDIPIFREVCGDAVFYVPLRDVNALAKMIELLTSGELDGEIEKKISIGRERIRAFGAECLGARWQELVRNYVASRRPLVL